MKKLEGYGKVKDTKATKQIVALLSAPLEKYNNVVTMLKLVNYPKVMEHLDYETNKVMAVVIIQSIMKNNTLITTSDKVFYNSCAVVSYGCQNANLLMRCKNVVDCRVHSILPTEEVKRKVKVTIVINEKTLQARIAMRDLFICSHWSWAS